MVRWACRSCATTNKKANKSGIKLKQSNVKDFTSKIGQIFHAETIEIVCLILFLLRCYFVILLNVEIMLKIPSKYTAYKYRDCQGGGGIFRVTPALTSTCHDKSIILCRLVGVKGQK